MKIVSVSIIRNESDILETFVRYHLQIVDHMIIVNHRSMDSSAEILKNLARESAKLELVEETALEQPQGRVLTTMMKRAARDYAADWIVPLDADEFIIAPGGSKVREVLSGLPGDRVVHMPWRTYVPLPTDNWAEANVLSRVRHRRGAENPQFYKVCIPALYARERHAELLFGSHRLMKQTFFSKKEYPYAQSDRLALAHFPVRSGEQIITKAITGWLSCLARPHRAPKENMHLKQLYDRFQAGFAVDNDELAAIALGYAGDTQCCLKDLNMLDDPVVPEAGDIILLYGTSYETKPLAILAHLSEEFARAIAGVRRNKICIKKRIRD
jgi:hypothetical protein